MTLRYLAAIVVAAAVTFGLFLLMHSLIAQRSASFEARAQRYGLDFIRLKRSEEVDTKQRVKPQRPRAFEPPPQAPLRVEERGAGPRIDVAKTGIPSYRPSFGFGDGSYRGAGTDTDAVPLVRVNPRYPARAEARAVEGWVYLRFTVTERGTTADIEVLDSDPKGYFERAAKSAVERYKYKPRLENGVPVARPGVEIVISFELGE